MTARMKVGHPSPRLLEWLAERDIDFEIHEHPMHSTASATADAAGVDRRTFAKVVGVIGDDGRRALVILDAPDRVELHKVEHVLGTRPVRLLSEAELHALAPDCDLGALPAVGELFGVPTFADNAVRADPEISFKAGTHRHTVRVDRVAWQGAAHVRYGDLVEDDGQPAWAL